MKKVLLLICLALLLSTTPCLVGTSLGSTKTVKVNVNGHLLQGDPTDSNHPNIYVRTNYEHLSNSTLKSTNGQNPVEVEYPLLSGLEPYYAKATLPNGQYMWKTYYGAENITFNFTCDPSNTIIVNNFYEGTGDPARIMAELYEKKSDGLFHLKDVDYVVGKVEFGNIKRAVMYQVKGYQWIGPSKVAQDVVHTNPEVASFQFVSDFQTVTHTEYYKHIGESKALGADINKLHPKPAAEIEKLKTNQVAPSLPNR